MADLSGSWLGTYWQDNEPTRFEMTLVQAGNTLSGRVLDDGPLGEAQLSGSVTGRSLSFTKQYLTKSGSAINYDGTVAEDENHISGRWVISGRFSGPWEARRNSDNLLAELKQRKSEELLVGGTVS